jgi:hypothetical protein
MTHCEVGPHTPLYLKLTTKPSRQRANTQYRLSGWNRTARESLHSSHSSTDTRRVCFPGSSLEPIDHERDVRFRPGV